MRPTPAVALFAILVAAAPAFAEGPVDDRISESVEAAARLQGPLDGGWTVRGERGRVLYVMIIVDPAGGAGPLQAVWRDPRDAASAAAAATIQRAGNGLWIGFSHPLTSPATALVLRKGREGWRGTVRENGASRPIAMVRTPRAAD